MMLPVQRGRKGTQRHGATGEYVAKAAKGDAGVLRKVAREPGPA
jgi:hypothetical protein